MLSQRSLSGMANKKVIITDPTLHSVTTYTCTASILGRIIWAGARTLIGGGGGGVYSYIRVMRG